MWDQEPGGGQSGPSSGDDEKNVVVRVCVPPRPGWTPGPTAMASAGPSGGDWVGRAESPDGICVLGTEAPELPAASTPRTAPPGVTRDRHSSTEVSVSRPQLLCCDVSCRFCCVWFRFCYSSSRTRTWSILDCDQVTKSRPGGAMGRRRRVLAFGTPKGLLGEAACRWEERWGGRGALMVRYPDRAAAGRQQELSTHVHFVTWGLQFPLHRQETRGFEMSRLRGESWDSEGPAMCSSAG